MSAFATEQAVTRTLATGGVCWPIAKFKVTIIPKWTGSIPTALTNGITIGTVKIIAATECKKKPIIKRNTLSIPKTAYLLFVKSIIDSATFCGICSIVKNSPSNTDAATNNITEAVWIAPSQAD